MQPLGFQASSNVKLGTVVSGNKAASFCPKIRQCKALPISVMEMTESVTTVDGVPSNCSAGVLACDFRHRPGACVSGPFRCPSFL